MPDLDRRRRHGDEQRDGRNDEARGREELRPTKAPGGENRPPAAEDQQPQRQLERQGDGVVVPEAPLTVTAEQEGLEVPRRTRVDVVEAPQVRPRRLREQVAGPDDEGRPRAGVVARCA